MLERTLRRWIGAALLAGCGLTLGCVESTWEATRRLDTVAGYNQFIRDHPDSSYVADARERMAFLRVKTYGTIEVFEEFRKRYPKSRLMPELLVIVEPLFFEKARVANSPQSYRQFLAMYPEGALVEKAVGNLAYVERVVYDPSAAALAQFVEKYPESDFWEEAKQTLEIVDSLAGTRIRRLGIRVDVAPNVVQADRVRKGFAAMIAKAYRERGVQAVPLRVDEPAGPDIDGWVRVDYREAPAASSIGSASLYVFCRVRLFHRDFDDPIWDRNFDAPATHLNKGAYGRDKTIFGNSSYPFWDRFFVPVATWAVSDTRVSKLKYLEDVRAVHVRGDSAALLLERGGVDFVDVSSPSALRVAERYRREVDLAEWHGVRLLRDNLAITFGNDGAELIRRADQAAMRVARWDAGELGAVTSAMLFDDATLLIGGSQGLFAVRMNRAPLIPQRLLDGEVVGIEVKPPLVYVVRPDRLEVALPKHLLQHITARKISLGKGFRAERVRMSDDQLLVFGKDRVAEVSLEQPTRPQVIGTVEHSDVGQVADMASDGKYRYILGERGLQVTSLSTVKPRDFIQVGANDALTLKGRFALLVGQSSVEVLDLAPYAESPDPTLAYARTQVRRQSEAAPASAAEVAPGTPDDQDASVGEVEAPAAPLPDAGELDSSAQPEPALETPGSDSPEGEPAVRDARGD